MNFQGYYIDGNKAYARAKTLRYYPSKRTIFFLKNFNVKTIIYQDGSFLCL